MFQVQIEQLFTQAQIDEIAEMMILSATKRVKKLHPSFTVIEAKEIAKACRAAAKIDPPKTGSNGCFFTQTVK